ncbi:hypothetical protein WMF22_45805 [Sorangium sp. So ce204]
MRELPHRDRRELGYSVAPVDVPEKLLSEPIVARLREHRIANHGLAEGVDTADLPLEGSEEGIPVDLRGGQDRECAAQAVPADAPLRWRKGRLAARADLTCRA